MEAPIQAIRNLGLKYNHIFACDNSEHVHETIKANFPHRKFYTDIAERDNSKAPKVDLYIAGFPCQPFSSAGKQQGFEDQRGRGTIFFDVLDYLKKKKPKVFILENVCGLVTLYEGKYLQDILSSSTKLTMVRITSTTKF